MDKYDEQLAQAEILKQEGEHDQAIKLCQQILLQDLNCAEAYEELGDNYLSLQEYDKAEKALLQATRLAPDSPNACYLLGFVYSERHDYDKAIEFFEKSNDLRSNHPEVLRCLGWVYFQSGAPRQGLILLERARTLTPDDTLILFDLGTCLLSSRRQAEARKTFAHVLELEPHNEKAQLYLAQIDRLTKTKHNK